jgi:hypothetical protein
MSATFIVTTHDPQLAAEWSRQLPSASLAHRSGESLVRELKRPGARVWIRDICDADAQHAAHPDTVVIVVGEPRSVPFEDAKNDRSNAFCLSYEESRTHLRRIAPMAADLAESRAVLSVLQERPRQPEAAPAGNPEAARHPLDDLEFLAAAIEHLDDGARLIEEFQRGVRARIRSSKVAVFVRDGDRFVSEHDGWACAADHDLVRWLQEHAAIVDSEAMGSLEDAATEASIRQKLGEWNSRLLVPFEVHGVLGGWVVFGPRADGRRYSSGDRDDSLMLVGVFSRLLGKHRLLRAAQASARDVALIQSHGPKFCVTGSSGGIDAALPVEVREVASVALREGRRVEREFGSLRVSAGPIPGTGECWVWWDQSALTAAASADKREAERHQILHDLGIMISHELANAMFSVSTYFQHLQRQRPPDEPAHPLIERVSRDMERMKAMPHLLSTLYEMSKRPTARFDLKRVVQSVAKEVNGHANTPEAALTIWGHERNLREALVWLCHEVLEPKEKVGTGARDAKITISLQEKGRGDEAVCLVTIAYPGLRVDQIKVGEASATEEYPTVPVYLAREVIRFHHGTVHVGQGIDGPELMITVRSRRVAGLAEVEPVARKQPPETGATPFPAEGGAAAGDTEAFPESA